MSEKKKDLDSENKVVWDRPVEFMFTLMGYNVGLGMLWRFPYLCYRNGGGAFLIPFLISCIFISLPLYTFEIGLGQFTRRGRIGSWDRLPIMKGVAFASLFIAAFCEIPYMLIMAWAILFFVHSFTLGKLPWTTCDNDWNSNSCLPHVASLAFSANSTNTTIYESSGNTTLPQVEFWREFVLQATPSIDIIGSYNSKMALYLLAACVTVFMVTLKGVKTSGKVVYLTATLPYIMLVILLVRGVTLPGAGKGIAKFLLPDMAQLKKPAVWMEGISQAFYIYGLGFPSLTAFGSYNKKKADFFRQSAFVIPCGIVTSILMGFVTFSILGHLAHETNLDMEDVIKSGPGLVFQVFPAALALMPLPQLWSVLFFLTLYFVAIDSAFGEFEGIITALGDLFPTLISTSKRRIVTNISIGFIFYIACQIMLIGPGIYIFELLNYYGASGLALVCVVMFESTAVGWMWNAEQYRSDVMLMTGRLLPRFFNISFQYIIPIITSSIFIFYCITWKPLTVGGYSYPVWANVIGWFLTLASVGWIPFIMIRTLWNSTGTLKQRWNNGCQSKHDFRAIHQESESKAGLDESLL